MKFMLMMNSPSKGGYAIAKWPENDLRAHIAFMKTFNQKISASGELVSAEGLSSPEQAKLVRASPDGRPITDGVFPESKEFLAGFWIVDVDRADRAYALAAEISVAPGIAGAPLYLAVEVRPIMSAP